MYRFSFINSFIFDKVTYSKYHHGNLSSGVKHHYIMYLKKGSAKIISENNTLLFKQGDIGLIPRGTKYNTHLWGTPEIEFYSFGYLNFPNNITKTYSPQKIDSTPRILELIEKLTVANSTSCRALGIFFLLLDEILNVAKPPSHMDKNQVVLENAMNHIIMNPDCKMVDVAKACHISEPALYLLFRNYSDTTPAKFRMNIILEKACNYLLTTDLSIEKISEICGFSSASYFRKNFYKVYQKTPREFRNEQMPIL